MSHSLRVLLIEDMESDALVLVDRLRRGGYEPDWRRVDSLLEVRAVFAGAPWDIILCDNHLPSFRSLDVLSLMHELGLDWPLIVVSGRMTEAETVAAMKAGARDYIRKESMARLVPAIVRELRDTQIRKERQTAHQEIRLLQSIASAISDTSDVHLALGSVLRQVCVSCHWVLGQAWLLNGDNDLLECSPAWHGDASGHEGFRQASLALKFGASMGLPGSAWSDRNPVWRRDFSCETGDVRAPLAAAANLRASVGVPVLAGQKVVAIIEFFRAEALDPDDRFMGLITTLAAQLGHFIHQKQAEEALRKSEELFRRLCDCSPFGILVTDEKGLCIFSNPRCRKILGVSLVQSLEKGWFRWVHPDDHSTLVQQWFATVAARSELSSEFRIKTDGRQIWARLRSSMMVPEQGQGQGSGYVVTIEDISEQKQMEAQFLQAQKMESIGRLAGGVAHDFNNLLTAINSFARLAQDSLPPDSQARSDIEMVLKAADRAANLTRQLLAFARREVINPQVLNPNVLLLDLERMLTRLIRENITLKVKPGDQVGSVNADPSQLEQVLINLVVNAADAMPAGGRLTIETANAELSAAAVGQTSGAGPGQYIALTVTDTGTGITDEVKAHIFEPFFTTKELGKGTGLGLATVYGIVKQNGGHIEVSSQVGEGTSFRVYLPRVAAVLPPEARSSQTEFRPKGSENILLVEDEPQVRWLAKRVLTAQGYQVTEAANGEEGLQVARQNAGVEFHLLVTDMVMPRMGGKMLAERIRLERPLLKVLFMSGYSDEWVDNQQEFEEGSGFLRKPYKPEELVRKVYEMIHNSPAPKTNAIRPPGEQTAAVEAVQP
ncbi:MAG: response regulator [Opitutaceae bacterium]|nr:response regulator [Verrucomicrobiales bacterium]